MTHQVMVRRRTRILYVTGKGGVGKSFVAAELAREAVERGQRCALLDVLDPTATIDEHVADAGATVARLAVDPREALQRVLDRLLRFPFLSQRLLDSRTFSAVAAAAPGLKDLVTVDYLRELSEGRVAGSFDTIVVNAPASGHSIALLEAPHRIAELVPFGPAASIARAARDMLTDRARFRAVPVTLAEELCVSETIELRRALACLAVAMTPTVVNGVYPARGGQEETSWLLANTASLDARLYLSRRARQLELAERVSDGQQPAILLPYIFAGTRGEAAERARLLDALVAV